MLLLLLTEDIRNVSYVKVSQLAFVSKVSGVSLDTLAVDVAQTTDLQV